MLCLHNSTQIAAESIGTINQLSWQSPRRNVAHVNDLRVPCTASATAGTESPPRGPTSTYPRHDSSVTIAIHEAATPKQAKRKVEANGETAKNVIRVTGSFDLRTMRAVLNDIVSLTCCFHPD